nr:hypothetical protein GCM10020093_112510 [Planobispora longispora]
MNVRPRMETSGLSRASDRNMVTRTRPDGADTCMWRAPDMLGCSMAPPTRADQPSQKVVETVPYDWPDAWSSR